MTPTTAKGPRQRTWSALTAPQVRPVLEEYIESQDADPERRRELYRSLVTQYYDLATDFYEFGWGTSFHFAPRERGENLKASLLRHQHSLAAQLSLGPEMTVLDAGCGVGGPMGTFARHYGATMVGLNLNAYQIERAKHHTRDVASLCRFIHGDFMQIPEEDDRFDAAIAIESMCHAPDRGAVFAEILRVLRPGACFLGQEWCLTERFDPQDPEHQRIKRDILIGAGLPDLGDNAEVRAALAAAGFEILTEGDSAAESHPDTPWYRALQGRDLSLASIPRTPAGRALINMTLRVAQRLRLAPEGAAAVSTILNAGGDALVAGGRAGVFTPLYCFLARKPG
ncbi:MAG: methyltransferase domain-containing protein [Acidimicrobiia bacterium]|nr:methyltransferase domain-containing protein [Acidimicrobiia bacterium]